MVGEVNGGWRATMTTLANERSLSGGTSGFPQILKLARRSGATADPASVSGWPTATSRTRSPATSGSGSRPR